MSPLLVEGFVYKGDGFYSYDKDAMIVKKVVLDVYEGQRCARICYNISAFTDEIYASPEDKPKMLVMGSFGICRPIIGLAIKNGYKPKELEDYNMRIEDYNMRINESGTLETYDGTPIKSGYEWFPKFTDEAFENLMKEQKEVFYKYCLPDIQSVTDIRTLDNFRISKLTDNPHNSWVLPFYTSVYEYKTYIIDKTEFLARAEDSLERAKQGYQVNYVDAKERFEKEMEEGVYSPRSRIAKEHPKYLEKSKGRYLEEIDYLEHLIDKINKDDCDELYTTAEGVIKDSREACERFFGR